MLKYIVLSKNNLKNKKNTNFLYTNLRNMQYAVPILN